MNNKQNIYLDKVIEYLVRDTKIDYENEKISTPFPLFPSASLSRLLFFSPSLFPHHYFTSYCKVVYGLTDQEIEYVWKEYKEIIKDKITNK